MKLIYNIKLAMLACHLWFLSNAIAASIRFVQPAGGAVISAGRALDVQWIYPDSLDAQLASDRLNLFLCAGGNEFGSYVSYLAPEPNPQLISGEGFGTNGNRRLWCR